MFQRAKYAQMEARLNESLEKHQKTLEACQAVQQSKWQKASKLFFEAAEESQIEQSSKLGAYHVVFVLDESGSMVIISSTHAW